MANLKTAAQNKQVLEVLSELTPDELTKLYRIALEHQNKKQMVQHDLRTIKPRG